jgi:hypothetical protein
VIVGAACVSLLAASVASALTAKPSKARSTKGMKMGFAPKRGLGGTTFKAAATGFAKGEPVLASEIGHGRRASRLPAGSASRAGLPGPGPASSAFAASAPAGSRAPVTG